MDIERINENTVKFYISYIDIENRGFDREEIWYNRERSEELFWEMMEEVHQEQEFSVDGPLWIQVQALEKGLEILVTKAQISKDGQRFELPIPNEKNIPVDENIEELVDQQVSPRDRMEDEFLDEEEILQFVFVFDDFEDLILLSKRSELDQLITKLFHFEGKYYLSVEFPEIFADDEEKVDDLISVMLEYGNETAVTVYRLQEYGKEIISRDVFSQIRKYFS